MTEAGRDETKAPPGHATRPTVRELLERGVDLVAQLLETVGIPVQGTAKATSVPENGIQEAGQNTFFPEPETAGRTCDTCPRPLEGHPNLKRHKGKCERQHQAMRNAKTYQARQAAQGSGVSGQSAQATAPRRHDAGQRGQSASTTGLAALPPKIPPSALTPPVSLPATTSNPVVSADTVTRALQVAGALHTKGIARVLRVTTAQGYDAIDSVLDTLARRRKVTRQGAVTEDGTSHIVWSLTQAGQDSKDAPEGTQKASEEA